MQVNRFTNISNPRFDPMSLQELMMVPSYKRGQHDAISEGIAETEAKLAQIDPLQYHEQLANEEQEKYYNKLSQQADLLNSEGFTSQSKSDFMRLNKEYQQAIGPTGTIGKINAAKQIYNQNFKDYMNDAIKNKKWSREDALRNWQLFESQNYTGFGEDGTVANIGQYGAPEKIELLDRLKDVKSLLGDQVVREISAGNYAFGRQPDGSLMIVNRNGRRIETSNAPNIQNAMNMLNAELQDPNSAWSQSLTFEGINGDLFNTQLTEGLSSMLETDVKDNRTQSVNFRGVNNSNDLQNPNVPSVTEPVVEYNNKREKLQNLVSKIGKPKNKLSREQLVSFNEETGKYDVYGFASKNSMNYRVLYSSNTDPSAEVYTENDFSESELQKYNTIYDSMKENGLLSENATKFTKDTNEFINKYIEDTSKFSFSNKILKPNAIDNDLQKPLIFTPKKGFDMERHLQQELLSGRRTLIDKETQKPVDIKDLQGSKFDYVGMVSPDNVLEINDDTIFNDDTLVIPHVIQAENEEGEVKEYYMDRDSEEMKKPEFQASKIIKNTLFKSKLVPGLTSNYSSPQLQSKGIVNVISRYNPNTDTYDLNIQADNGDTFTLKDATSSNIQKTIYRLFSQNK